MSNRLAHAGGTFLHKRRWTVRDKTDRPPPPADHALPANTGAGVATLSQIPAPYEPPAPLSPFWNMFWNSGGIAAGIVVSFFLSPFLIRTLGDGPYGMLALIGEITGYYGLLDLGMRTAVGYFVARGVARRDLSAVNDVMHNIFWILSAAAGIVVIISLAVMYEAPRWFTIQGVSGDGRAESDPDHERSVRSGTADVGVQLRAVWVETPAHRQRN